MFANLIKYDKSTGFKFTLKLMSLKKYLSCHQSHVQLYIHYTLHNMHSLEYKNYYNFIKLQILPLAGVDNMYH